MMPSNNANIHNIARPRSGPAAANKKRAAAAFGALRWRSAYPLISGVPRLSYHPKAVALVKALAMTLPRPPASSRAAAFGRAGRGGAVA